jgi:predicted nucleic acid-binding protein
VKAGPGLYLDTSVILRAVLETGMMPDVEAQIAGATLLVTSRLTHVEAARALTRLRALGTVSEVKLADANREIGVLLAHCETWELTKGVCRLACEVAPRAMLRTLDALHLATFLQAREIFGELDLVTVDDRLRAAAFG